MVKRYFGGLISSDQASLSAASARGMFDLSKHIQAVASLSWPNNNINVEYLIIAGGNAGGNAYNNPGVSGGSGVVVLKLSDAFPLLTTTGNPTITTC
jgi:hypothetical protein